MSKEIPLTRGMVAVVDDQDYRFLAEHKWYYFKTKNKEYAARNVSKTPHVVAYMHRAILGLVDSKIEVDHKDGDGLNNRRDNLRAAKHFQNIANQPTMTLVNGRPKSSKYKGVYWEKNNRNWVARIGHERTRLGVFDSEIEAAKAYDLAALSRYGEFARVNLPMLSREK